MAISAVRQAIEEKQKAIIEASGAKIGRRLTKVDVVDRLVELADLPPERTKNSITGQVNALKVIAEIEGYVIDRYADVTKEFAGRTVEEKEFFATHGYWPIAMEPAQPGSPGAENPSKGAPAKPAKSRW